MAFELREGQGSLWKNKHAEENDKAPAYKGKAMVNGRVMDIGAWIRKTDKGVSYMSLSIKPDQQSAPAGRKPQPQRQQAQPEQHTEEDIPF